MNTEELLTSTEELPLSYAQQRLWFLDQLQPNSAFYNIPIALSLEGSLNIAALEQSLQEIIARHEALRTNFVAVNGEATQVIHEEINWTVSVVDLTYLSSSEQENTAQELVQEKAVKPFDLANDSLIQATLIVKSKTEHILLICMHHIVSDGWSMGLFLQEFATLYDAYIQDKPSPLAPLEIQYADFALWQREYLQGDLLETQLSYWKQQLADATPILPLPIDKPRPPVQSFNGAYQTFTLSPELCQNLTTLSQQQGVTLFMTLLAAFDVLLSRYSGITDILIGTPIANRNQDEIEGVIGFFVNTLVLRADLSENPSFEELLVQVREAALDAYAYQDLPLEMLVEALQPERNISYTPLFQVMFSLEDSNLSTMELTGLNVSSLPLESGTAKFDLSLSMQNTANGLMAVWEYNTDLFESSTIERMVGHFVTLLEGIVANPQEHIAQLPLLTEVEQHQLLVDFNNTQTDYPENKCIHQLFEEQVKKTPDNIAVEFNNQKLTYRELNSRANQLAHYLQSLGVSADVLVGLCVERSLEMIVGMLGVLKAGGAYLPIDPNYPSERISFMLEDSQVSVLLTQQQLIETLHATSLPQHQAQVICLDTDWQTISQYCNLNLAHSITPENLAYIIYTSGSTGQPKGVMIQHQSLVNYIQMTITEYELSNSDRFLQFFSISFDAAIEEIYSTLTCGATLVLRTEEMLSSVQRFIQKCLDWDITLVSLPTAYWHQLTFELVNGNLQLPPSLRLVLIGGEQLIEQRLQMWQEYVGEYPQLINEYGPTEATVAVTISKFPDSAPTEFNQPKASIGRPIQNVEIYILDSYNQPVPIGVAGELHIGGVCLSRGYLNRPELTAEKFIPHPFDKSKVKSQKSKLYKTGDLARYLPDGNIEYLGRIDNQVKIRGFRIELGEIETVLSQYSQIQASAVIVREDTPGDKRLVAYLVAKKETTLQHSKLRQFLKAKLPEYMVPSAFVVLESLPLTPSGKVDRRALPAPDFSGSTDNYITPRTPTEEILAQIWSQVLKVEKVGINDNFFELGGHSLLATQLVSRIRSTFKIELPLRQLFATATVGELAPEIEQLQQQNLEHIAPPILPRTENTPLPLSYAQQRLWFLEQFQPNSALYNMPMAFRLVGTLNQTALEQSLQTIIQRHEALRTNFVTVDGEPTQIIQTATNWNLSVVDLSHLSTTQQEIQAEKLVQQQAIHSFDLANESLIKATIVLLNDTESLLLVCMHHIVSDGWSMGILVQELASLYDAYSQGLSSLLTPLSLQYADFAVWQRQWLQGEVLQSQLSYWQQQLDGAPTLLSLPTDRPRPAAQSFAGAIQQFELSLELTEKLIKLSQEQGVTLFMILLAVFDVLLYRYSGQSDILVGTPIANRNRSEIEGLIGFFVNTLVLRADLSGNPSFSELLTRVRDVSMDAYVHQDLPFEMLVEALQPERDLSHSPLFQVMFILQNTPVSEVELSGLSVNSVKVQRDIAPFDLTLGMENTASGLMGIFEYNTDLFDASTIKRMIGHFVTLLEAIVAHPQTSISYLPLLTTGEQQQILFDWNNTKTDYPASLCIHQLFEQQVKLTPNAIAVEFNHQQLTYQQLNIQANQLANYLQSLGVKPEVFVGIYLERSLEMIVALLAIQKAGGAYVPLDPDYPLQRLAYICEDSNINLLITQQKLLDVLPINGIDVIVLETESEKLTTQSPENPVSDVQPQNLCCLLYTSGSTGKPKGVMLTHAALVNHSSAISEVFGLTDKDRVLQFASLGFDVAAEEIFPTWLKGGTVVLRPSQMFPDFASFAGFIQQQKLSVLNITPAYWHEWAVAVSKQDATVPESLHLVAVGGDTVLPETVTMWKKLVGTRVNCLNVYGPTEASVTAVVYDLLNPKLEQINNVLIGRPIANTQTYILDPHLQPVPVGVIGELHLGGVRLARGYLNRDELTQEKFLSNPFDKSKVKSQKSKLYKTGDLARYLPDGNIECLGRIDNQVKIRGFRIELGEIETVLNRNPQVQTSCVILREDTPGDKRLVGYVVPSSQQKVPTNSELRQFLSSNLPLYMVPSAFVFLESLPLTPNRKVDRRALPIPDLQSQQTDNYIAPRTPTEEILAQIWAQVLKIELVGIDDNFFELGGHSLLATQVVSRIRNSFQVELPLRQLFACATVAQLADVIGQYQQTSELTIPPILPKAEDTDSSLSYAQNRLWFLDQLDPNSATYNMPMALRLFGRLNIAALEQSLIEIISRHQTLQTNFIAVDGQPKPIIKTEKNWAVSRIDLTYLSTTEAEIQAKQLSQQQLTLPFDLANDSLIRVTLLTLNETEYWLIVCMHHIVSDGWSMGVFVEELTALYEAYSQGQPTPLPSLPIQYTDYAAWQKQWLQGEVLQSQLSYWEEQLADAPTLLSLPTDRPRPAVQTFEGAYQKFTLSAELTQKLTQLCQQQGVTLFMTLLAAFDTLLYRYSGQSDILVGTPIANRNYSEIEGLIGFFSNTLVMRTDLSENPSFSELLTQVRQTAIDAYAHQDLPFEMLVEALKPNRDLSHTPLFQVAFVLQNTPIYNVELTGLSISDLPIEMASAKFDLTLGMEKNETGIKGVFEYNTDLFDASTMARMAAHFVTLLEGIIDNPQMSISQLPLLTEIEQQQLLIDWNNTDTDYPHDLCIHQLFEQQVEQNPHAVAVVFEGAKLTYFELNHRANQLAHYLLQNNQIQPDTLIGICVERSIEMIVGILAILKAGGAYVPLDPDYPQERLSYMLEDAQVSVLLTQAKLVNSLPQHQTPIICLDTDWEHISQAHTNNLNITVRSENLAYVIYTSGSTGTPKGVAVNHQAINRLVLNTNYIKITANDCIAQAANIAFDAATFEIWGALLTGAKFVIITKSVLLNAQEFAVNIDSHKINVLFLTTALFNQLASLVPQAFSSLKYLLFGGELVDPFWVQEVLEKGAPQHLLHVYGPTENTTFSSWYLVEELPTTTATIPIGRPIANTQIYILDNHNQPVPVGVPGELHIGGVGVARGYLNRPELTKEKFIPNPFDKSFVKSQKSKLYKTGDLARYLPDGKIEFLGRIDNQVKIRGFRIEIGEIEAALSQLPQVREAVVVPRENEANDKHLVAYVVPQQKSLELSNKPKNSSTDTVELWPSIAEYYVYDDLLYYAMTNDHRRNNSYKVAINQLVKGKVVLEIGTGKDAILSRFCVAAGAAKIYAIERDQETYLKAKACIEKLGFADKITVIHGDATVVELPEKADVCVSEIVGAIGGSEGAAIIINNARRFLKPGGLMIPERSVTKMALVTLPDEILHYPQFSATPAYYTEKIFEQVGYSFDLRVCIKKFPQANVLSTVDVLEDLNFNQPIDVELSHEVKFEIQKNGRMDGFLVWLNLHTISGEEIDILEHEYCWLPVYFPVFEPGIEVEQGDVIQAVCSRTLCDNNLNPDYAIKGCLLKSNGETVEFEYVSYHYKQNFRQTPFYRRLFNDDNLVPSLRATLKQHLPDYMVPSNFVILENLPLTPNGKVDRRALPAPDVSDRTNQYIAPRTPTEETLTQIWSQILKVELVGIDDNFFELGGHSLLATQVISRVQNAFGISLPLRTLFESPTIAQLSQIIITQLKTGLSDRIAEIVPVSRDTDIPLSWAQERLWFVHQLEGNSGAYTIDTVVRLKGNLNIKALEQAFQAIVQRHEPLRTRFEIKDDKPIQVIDSDITLMLPVVNLQNVPDPEKQLKGLTTEAASLPFDIKNDSVLRVGLWQVSPDEYVLLFAIHHIAADGWSMGILVEELSTYYQAFSTGESAALPELPIQYADFAVWQRQWLTNEVLDRQLSYWKQQLTGAPPLLELPTDRPRPAVQTFRGGTEHFQLTPQLTQQLKTLSQESGTTLFMTLLAGFAVLASRYSGQSDLVIGSPIANRNRTEIEGLIGFFVNSLALRFDLSQNPTFEGFLSQVKQVTQDAYEHQDLPFEMLVEELKIERNLDRNPLIQVVFALQNAPSSPWEMPGLTVEGISSGLDSVRTDLEVYLWDNPEGLEGFCSYNRDLFDEETIRRMMSHFQTLLTAIVENPQQSVTLLPLLTQPQRYQLLREWNNTQTDYSEYQCLHQLFEEMVEKTPNAVAVVFVDGQDDDSSSPQNWGVRGAKLTYSELNSRANQLARYLQSLGVSADVLVGLCVERSPNMIIGLLAILKAGGAYVPLDPDYPTERLSYMLEDSQVSLLLTQEKFVKTLHATSLPQHQAQVVDFDSLEITQYSDKNLTSVVTPSNLANVIYTSGSTGKPKGVMVEHKGLYNLALAQIQTFGVNSESRVLQFASFSFDACISEILMSLGSGAALYLGTKDTFMPGKPLIKQLRASSITHITLPPSALAVLPIEELPQLQTIIVAGEACTAELIKKWSVGRNFFNGYGPTETSVCATIAQCNSDDEKVTIGCPIANVQVYILDSHHQPVPVGVPGELHIGGVGVARGYLNRPELTKEKFIPNPFDKSFVKSQKSKLYKTGDLARYLPDGKIEFLGRIDNQVKIRGFRIELGEIEAVLSQYPFIQDAVVVPQVDSTGDKSLVAYLVPALKNQVLPQQMAQWESEYVSDWQMLYEQAYGQPQAATDESDVTFNISGWNSSYTGLPIPAEEMQLWVDTTVSRILSLSPQRVLEIGCGTGLLLSRIAPKCQEYWGADYSSAALQQVEQISQTVEGLEQVRLLHQMADDFTDIPQAEFDTVVINSVVQYFPSVEYLLQVIDGAIATVGENGAIFVGDVRSLPLLEAYHAAVQLSRSSADTTVEQWQKQVNQTITAEEELVIDPRFFIALQTRFPQITSIEIKPKRGYAENNELTQFRYDVTLHVGGEVASPVNSGLNWQLEQLSITQIETQLQQQQPEILGIRGVSNQRVQQALQVCQWLEEPPQVETVSQLQQLLGQQPTAGINPEQFWELGQHLGYQVDVSWWEGRSDGCYDVVFHRNSFSTVTFCHSQTITTKAWNEYTNNPLYGKLVQKLVPQVRQFVQQKLPNYMVPQTFVLLNALPLTPNGKVDRKALPTPDNATRNLSSGFAAPRNSIETQLVQVWGEVLGIERIGIQDNFFELGGHSLLATQVISRLSDIFSVELSLQNFLEYPTVASLAQNIEVLEMVQNSQPSLSEIQEDYEEGEL